MKKLMLVFILIILFIGGCKKEGIPDNNIENTNAEKTLKGITLTPRSFAPNDFTNFFVKAKQTGHIITWSGDWIELSNTNKGGPTVLAELSKQYNFIPLVITQFFTQSTGKLLRPLDEATKQTYKNSAVAFAEKYKPKYMGLGIEVNMLYENFPNDFENFVSFYNEVYNAIKAVSPETKIFTVFQLEKMKGLGGGLFGGTNDINKAQWFLIDKFQSDTIVFTTYPGLIYKDPTDIPVDYYEEIRLHTNKPIAFTEIGWHTSNSPIGWESSEHEQAEFIKTFFELTKDISKEFIIYSFMFDQNTIEPFNSAGLYDSSGNPRLALNEWQKH
ncbi:MAG TPA: hypothetical protein VJH20_00130 [Candidatus Nanoarchaeia archaeon]|nr:hypothetical protein [Candidatus Nanoarchaeia archaeon]